MKEQKETTRTADISFEIGYKENKTRFDLRMISVAEEMEIQEQFNNLADNDSEKSAKEYQICLDALSKFSVNDFDKTNFSEMDVKNERVIRAAYRQFMYAMNPTIDFL